MRAALGPVIANLLLAGAGMGVLWAVAFVEFSPRGLVGAFGLAFLTGVASVGALLVTALVVGIPYNLGTIVVASLGVAALGWGVGLVRRRSALVRLRGRSWRLDLGGVRRRFSPRSVQGYLSANRFLVVFALAFAIYAVVGLVTAAVTPLTQWDAWAIWTPKALVLTNFQHLPVGFFTGPSYLLPHQDYPLLVPLLESIWFRSAGTVDTQAVHVELWLLLVGFVWSAAYLMHRRGARILLWGPLLLAAALASGLYTQLLSGYADVPMALFAGLGFLLLGLWITEGRRAQLALAVLFLAAAANTKNEGLPIAVIALLAAGLAVGRSRPGTARNLALAAGALVIIVLPWHAWTSIHGIPADHDAPISKVADLSYMFGRTGRIWPSMSALEGVLSDEGSWSYVVPIGAGIAVSCLFWRVARRLALFYLGTAALIFLLYVLVYWVSPDNLSWYLTTSANRVVDVLIFVALAAGLQLPAEVAAGARRRGAQPRLVKDEPAVDDPAARVPLPQ
ncbi:MAG: hypothetical protein QOJ25_2423 [Solirubrobacteraceae bacterium]|nr:hypothetical protein [Solirubrobacteraceae bacterium]